MLKFTIIKVINMIQRSLALLFGLIVGVIGYIYSTKKNNNIKENFLPPMTYKVDRVAAPNEDFAHKGEFWSVPGTYQSLVAPRSASVQYGSQIQYNLPPESLLAYRSDTPFANDGLLLTTGEGDIVQPVTYDRFMFSNKIPIGLDHLYNLILTLKRVLCKLWADLITIQIINCRY
jgi:hypothetical protein